MNEGDTFRQLLDLNEQQRHEIELLKARIKELEARLAKYENPHTPPSLRRGGKGRRGQTETELGKPGQKIGHEGATRLHAKPDR